MAASEVEALIGLIRSDIEQAADTILTAAEMAIRDVAAARNGQPEALDRLERTLCAVLEACAFQDLAGQRLAKLGALLSGFAPSHHPETPDPLLNGPALPGTGLDQAAADALLAAGDR